MYKYACTILLLISGLFLISCSDTEPEGKSLGKPLLLWHFWDEKETEVLNELLDKFSSVYPHVTVIHEGFGLDELPSRFKTQARLGLGPDLLIVRGRLVQEFADTGLIQNLSSYNVDLSMYLSTAVNTLRYQDGIYGLPLSLHACALYYNKRMVDKPAATLQALSDQAAEGTSMALNTSFYGAFWGIQAFGGKAFDEEGRVILNHGGFSNWLSWLKKAQNAPNIILSNDDKMLHTLFTQERVAYYTAGSEELFGLQKALGEDVVGVVPLPAGLNNPSGPILEVEAMMVNSASSATQTALALRLAQFLTNFEQQTELTRQLGRVPANSRVWIDPRAYPAVAGFVAQTKTAVSLPNMYQVIDVELYGNDAYVQALAGVEDVQRAADRLTNQVNSKYGIETLEVTSTDVCDVTGSIEVWHTPFEIDAAVLDEIRRNFMRLCPGSIINVTTVDLYSQDVRKKYMDAVDQGRGPDLLLGSNHDLTALLASDGVLRDLNDLVEPEFLQRYIPEVLEAMSYEGKLYALPLSITELMALYYNDDLVSDPPLVLDDLLNQADPERQVILPFSFYDAYWGLSVFGAKLFNDDYRVILHEGGFAKWLDWLQRAQDHPGIVLIKGYNIEEAQVLFAEGKAAYFAGDVSQLSELQAALGKERLRVVPLPAGSEGKSGPILGVSGLMLNSASGAMQTTLAIEFAKYAAGVESQMLLMEQENQVPTNVNADTSAYPAIAGFLEQARTASVPPIVPQIESVLSWGDDAYFNVLEKNLRPAAAVNNFVNTANKANGFSVNAPEAPPVCEENGKVLLWHSWPEAKAAVLKQVITDFAEYCPGIQVDAKFVSADTLPDRLRTASVEDSAPDFFLAPHSWIGRLRQDALIKNIKPLVEETIFLKYRPGLIEALEYHDALYGLPLSYDVMALYYNTGLIDEPAETLDELLSAATPETPVALNSSFYGAFWGIALFGGRLYDKEGELALDQGGFVDWLAWLKTAQERSGMIFSPDQAALQELFAGAKTAYLTAGVDALSSLRAALGAENVGVTLLPAGANNFPARPFWRVEEFLFSARANEKQTQFALAFAKFATSDASQTLLMKETNLAPTNRLTLVTIDDAAIKSFSDAIPFSIPMLDSTMMSGIESSGDKAYRDVLTGAAEPEEAVKKLMQTVKKNSNL